MKEVINTVLTANYSKKCKHKDTFDAGMGYIVCEYCDEVVERYAPL